MINDNLQECLKNLDDQFYISNYSIGCSYNIDKRTIDVSLSLEYSSFDELYNEIIQKFKEKMNVL